MTPPADFDPEKTQFSTRRWHGTKSLPLIVIGVLVLGSGALIVWSALQPSPPPSEDALAGTPTAHPVATVAPFVPAPTASAALNLDVKDPGNAEVRDEVLRRIDLMPGVTAANKDKLYASVDHARSMGKVLTIPFVKGETSVRPAEIERLRQQLASREIHPIADDPTVVFVVLGYADPKGSDKVNAEVSLNRARAVLDALRDKCGVQNVLHAVAMGGSTMFSTQQADKNRVVEVWMVQP